MPQPRKASPRRRDSRRSRSFSPRPSHSRRRSRSRSPKDRRHSRSRSRSPVRKRSPPQRRQRSPKHYSPPRQRSRSPQRKRSRTPQRKRSRTPQRKRSRTPQRKRSWSPQRKRSQSPVDRSYPVKRQADSSGKRQSYRSRSPSPAPVKRSKDGRFYQEESPDEWRYLSSHKQHSPSPRQRSSSPYGGKMYADQSPSSSKRPLFPAAEKKRRGEIESVKIVDKVRKEKLDKRFQTLEQLAQGHFEFEENITIGIHRGPSHMELDEDVPVDYDINLKTFVMIFPKKDYQKAIFDRDEIKAFHHDDILDEEAYVEKRTITVKPTDKQKQKWSDETEYKITIGGDQCGYGDRRRVQDSGSRSRGSRSSHGESDVKVRLDPKPDPRYEKLYREHQRQEDESLMQENIQRNPNDLRYNLMRKNSTGDRGNRDRDRGSDRDHGRDSGMVDARSKIEARRQESHSGSRRDSDRKDIPRDGRDSRHSPPPSSIERKKPVHVKTDLPDFKNRPVKFLDRLGTSSTSEDLEIPPDEALRRLGGADTGVRTHWGHCEICNVPVNSAEQATEHVYGAMHCKNEHARKNSLNSAFGPSRKMSCYDDDDDARSSWRDREGHRHHGDAEDEGEDYPNAEEFEERERSDASFSKDETSRDIKKKYVWIFGTGEMKQCMAFADKRAQFGLNLGLARKDVSFVWVCNRGMLLADVLHLFQRELSRKPAPSIVILHVGGNDLQFSSVNEFLKTGKDTVDTIKSAVPSVKLVWSQMLPRWTGQDIASKLNRNRIQLEEDMACYVLNCGGCYIRYPMIMLRDRKLYKKSVDGDLFLDFVGLEKMLIIIKGSIMSIGRGISIIPDLKGLAPKINRFVRKNIQNRTKFLPIQKRV